MNDMTSKIALFGALVMVLFAMTACSTPEADTAPTCAGEALTIDAAEYCVFRGEITETGFDCPAGAPFLHEFPGAMVCAPGESIPDEHQDVIRNQYPSGDVPDEPGDTCHVEPPAEDSCVTCHCTECADGSACMVCTIAGCGSGSGCYYGACRSPHQARWCPVESPATGETTIVLDPDNGYPLYTRVVFEDDIYVMYTNLVVFGAGPTISRFESTDGVNFTNRLDLDGLPFWVGDVGNFRGTWHLYYHTSEDTSVRDRTSNAIGLATSQDGLTWADQGIIYEGSGEGFDSRRIMSPRVYFEHGRYHLYYTGYQKVCDIDDCGMAASVGYAFSENDRDFEYRAVPFAAELCPEIARYTSWRVADIARKTCATRCKLDDVHMLLSHQPCPPDPATRASWSLYHTKAPPPTNDGFEATTFTTPVRIGDNRLVAASIFDGEGAMWLYSDDPDAETVLLERVELGGEVDLACRQ